MAQLAITGNWICRDLAVACILPPVQTKKEPQFCSSFEIILIACDLTLRELEATTGFGLAVFLPFNNTWVTRQETT